MKNILIIEEDGFARVCAAILNNEGYITSFAVSSDEAVKQVAGNGISLIVSGYPLVQSFLGSESIRNIPVIILSNDLSHELIEFMKSVKNSVCMVKPLDFERFKYVVRGIMNGYLDVCGGNIIA